MTKKTAITIRYMWCPRCRRNVPTNLLRHVTAKQMGEREVEVTLERACDNCGLTLMAEREVNANT